MVPQLQRIVQAGESKEVGCEEATSFPCALLAKKPVCLRHASPRDCSVVNPSCLPTHQVLRALCYGGSYTARLPQMLTQFNERGFHQLFTAAVR